MKKIVVPEGILKAAMEAEIGPMRVNLDGVFTGAGFNVGIVCEAALRCLSENPIAPEIEYLRRFLQISCRSNWTELAVHQFVIEFQRHMFDEPEIPEELWDLLTVRTNFPEANMWRPDLHDKAVLEAFRRGQKSR